MRPGRSRRNARVRGLGRACGCGALAVVAAIGCAKREPPSGGPPDIEPPRIVETSPDSGAAGVPLDASFHITFSEGMEPRSTLAAVTLAPAVDFSKQRWQKRTLTLVPAEPLERDRTYMLFVANVARDRHGNPMETGKAILFSTADSFPPGRIEGEIEARGLAARGVYLWCYDADRGREPDSTAKDYDALGQADGEGRFRVDGLAVPGRYRLWAFGDLNGNRSFEPDVDVLVPADTVVALEPGRATLSDLLVRVVNPRAPANVRGTVLDSLGLEEGGLRIHVADPRDSTRSFAQTADSDSTFDIEIPAGSWTLRAYRDLNENGRWDADVEPASDLFELVLGPAEERVDLQMVLRRRDGEGAR